jgi:hypothetical protein
LHRQWASEIVHHDDRAPDPELLERVLKPAQIALGGVRERPRPRRRDRSRAVEGDHAQAERAGRCHQRGEVARRARISVHEDDGRGIADRTGLEQRRLNSGQVDEALADARW